MVIITNQSTGITACYLVGGSNPILLGQSNGSTEFTITADSAGKSNFYFSTYLILQNKTGVSANYCIMAFRTRTQL